MKELETELRFDIDENLRVLWCVIMGVEFHRVN